MKTGIFYGSTYGNTQEIGENLREIWGAFTGEKPEIFDVHSVETSQILDFDVILVGVSTWNDGQIQDDWDDRYRELDGFDFGGKIVALFGCGDQVAYSQTFVDALGIVGEKLAQRGATLVGKWPTEGYDFVFSKADLGDGFFIGLPLDPDNQGEQTTERLANWAAQVVNETSLVGVGV